jgi:two-component system, cell cycle sensor histidine kinase and response regulator CckA
MMMGKTPNGIAVRAAIIYVALFAGAYLILLAFVSPIMSFFGLSSWTMLTVQILTLTLFGFNIWAIIKHISESVAVFQEDLTKSGLEREAQGRIIERLESDMLVSALDLSRALSRLSRLEGVIIFSNSAAHDMNQMLQIIGSSLEFIDRNIKSFVEGKPLNVASVTQFSETAQRALGALSSQRELLEAYAGQQDIIHTEEDIHELLRRSLALLLPVTKDVEVVTDFQAVETGLLANAAQVQQAFVNVITNAVEAMEGLAHARLRVVTQNAQMGTIEKLPFKSRMPPYSAPALFVTVYDTGMGMDQETLDRVFEPFFTTKDAYRGMGMVTVMNIVHAHDGVVGIATSVGLGTAVTLAFPVPSN